MAPENFESKTIRNEIREFYEIQFVSKSVDYERIFRRRISFWAWNDSGIFSTNRRPGDANSRRRNSISRRTFEIRKTYQRRRSGPFIEGPDAPPSKKTAAIFDFADGSSFWE